jgi:hypothetical protein
MGYGQRSCDSHTDAPLPPHTLTILCSPSLPFLRLGSLVADQTPARTRRPALACISATGRPFA